MRIDSKFIVFFDLAIQVAGCWEALKDREGEMVEKRMLVNGVYHFRNQLAQKSNLSLKNSKVTFAR